MYADATTNIDTHAAIHKGSSKLQDAERIIRSFSSSKKKETKKQNIKKDKKREEKKRTKKTDKQRKRKEKGKENR